MPWAVRALRGAITVEHDTVDEITAKVTALLQEMLDRNQVAKDELISLLFTATSDLVSTFPATAARSMGFGDVPLICAREIDVVGSMPRCIRVMMHLNTEKARSDLHHVYLEGARGLRDDLPE